MARKFRIDEINKTVNFSFDYDEELIKAIKRADNNCRWNPELKEWILPVTEWSRPNILRIIKEWNFEQFKPVESDISITYEATPVNYAYLQGLCDSKDFAYKPRKYQLEALGYGMEKGSIINGDDVGLGKTFESIMYAEVTNSFPCLVIVPASVKYNWEEKWLEITKNKRRVAVIESRETKKRQNDWDADVIIINYDIVGKKKGRGATYRFDELKDVEWKMVICDEAHFLKKSKSMRSKVTAKIATKDASIVQLLTGTATMNKPVELWNLLLIIEKEEEIIESWQKFIYRYCGAYKSHFGWNTKGATNTLELNQRLRENCYIRREKKDVLTELPDVTRQVLRVDISNRKDYDFALNDFIKYLTETEGYEKAEKAEEAENLVALGVLRRLTIEGKMKAIEQYLKDWCEGDQKLLVFGLHREGLDYLSDKFKAPLIAGGVSAKEKQKIVKDWQTSDDLLLFGNMQSAGTGIDGLQNACSHMLIIELPWRPSDLTQCIGRLHRSGQKLPVTVTFLLSDDTMDSHMWEMLESKEQVTEAVNKGIDIRKGDSGLKSVLKQILGSKKKK